MRDMRRRAWERRSAGRGMRGADATAWGWGCCKARRASARLRGNLPGTAFLPCACAPRGHSAFFNGWLYLRCRAFTRRKQNRRSQNAIGKQPACFRPQAGIRLQPTVKKYGNGRCFLPSRRWHGLFAFSPRKGARGRVWSGRWTARQQRLAGGWHDSRGSTERGSDSVPDCKRERNLPSLVRTLRSPAVRGRFFVL